jgi:8-oxo-dGTP pyrophosphatase MutT (NUDIX family)
MTSEKSVIVRVRATVLIQDQNGRICFARHQKDGKTYWLLPGGGQDPFEPLPAAAGRELVEELRITVASLRFVCLRESFSAAENRHIQFPVFVGIDPDFSRMSRGTDARVAGVDFFTAQEIAKIPLYPDFRADLLDFLTGKPLEPFRTLEWVA